MTDQPAQGHDVTAPLSRAAEQPPRVDQKWSIPAQTSEVPLARHHVLKLVAEGGVGYNEDLLWRVGLLASEVITNPIAHTDTKDVDVHVLATVDLVRVEVRDHGSGDKLPHIRRRRAEDECGKGLLLVTLLANRWGIERGDETTTVWFEVEVEIE